MATSHTLSMSGAGSAPGVWDPVAFQGLDDARSAGLREHIKRFRGVKEAGGSDASDAREILEMLDAAAVLQLELF
ncbi:MAG: hypothetical protein AAF732_23290 [Pseudomonadota bacterium]